MLINKSGVVDNYVLPTERRHGHDCYDEQLMKEFFPFDGYGIDLEQFVYADDRARSRILLRRMARDIRGDLVIDAWTKRYYFEKMNERYTHEHFEWRFIWFRFEFEEDLALLLLQLPELVILPPEGTWPAKFEYDNRDEEIWKLTREY